jgi:hypothetical protein
VQRLNDANGKLLYAKRQVGHIYRSLLHPSVRPTVLRELDALNSFEQLGVRVPRIVCGAERDADHQWRALLVSEALDGFVELDTGMPKVPASGTHRWCMSACSRTWRTTWRACTGHWQHGCLYGKHVFIKVIGEMSRPASRWRCWTWKSRRRISAASVQQVTTCASCAAIRRQ